MEGTITEYEKRTIMEMSKRVEDALAKDYPQVKKEVGDVMGGKILEHEAKTILQRGIREGEIKGRIAGIMELVRDGILTLSEASTRLNMKEEELKTYLK